MSEWWNKVKQVNPWILTGGVVGLGGLGVWAWRGWKDDSSPTLAPTPIVTPNAPTLTHILQQYRYLPLDGDLHLILKKISLKPGKIPAELFKSLCSLFDRLIELQANLSAQSDLSYVSMKAMDYSIKIEKVLEHIRFITWEISIPGWDMLEQDLRNIAENYKHNIRMDVFAQYSEQNQ